MKIEPEFLPPWWLLFAAGFFAFAVGLIAVACAYWSA